jgi:hypothetical protein
MTWNRRMDNIATFCDKWFGWLSARVLIPACITLAVAMTVTVVVMLLLGIDRIRVVGGVIDTSTSSIASVVVMMLLVGIFIPLRKSFLRMLK